MGDRFHVTLTNLTWQKLVSFQQPSMSATCIGEYGFYTALCMHSTRLPGPLRVVPLLRPLIAHCTDVLQFGSQCAHRPLVGCSARERSLHKRGGRQAADVAPAGVNQTRSARAQGDKRCRPAVSDSRHFDANNGRRTLRRTKRRGAGKHARTRQPHGLVRE